MNLAIFNPPHSRLWAFIGIFLAACIFPTPINARADNNIRFLDKDVIQGLRHSVFEVVVPKVENDQLQYERALPFEKLSFKERNEKYFSIGTAFFINDLELMTAAHVLNLEYFSLLKDFHIRDEDGHTYKISRIKHFSSIRDMVVFELEHYPVSHSALAMSRTVEIGDTVFSVGNAQGEGISFRAGQVASFTTEPEYGKWKDIRFTSPASPGNSGGPLLNVEGKVVGLIIKKNESENYNIAVPISEFDNLANTAKFHSRNISMSINGNQNTFSMDWSVEFALPDTIQHVAKLAQESLHGFYEQVSAGANAKYESENFPKGKRFRDYLRDQINIRQFGVLNSDADFNKWTVNSYSTKTIPIAPDQKIIIGQSPISTFHVVIEKPQNLPLKGFLSNPKQVMDTLLKGLPLTRSVDVEKIRLVSLGEPERTETWEDKLGRRWISSFWYSPHTDRFAYTHCLPYPKGVICNVDIKETWHLGIGYLSLMKENLNEVAVGYEGGIDDWVEYVALGDSYLPTAFQKSQIAFNDEHLHIEMKDFKLALRRKGLSKKSHIHFHFGYSNKNLLEEDLLQFEVFPTKGVNAKFSIQKFFSPSPYSSDAYKAKWDEISQRTGDFSGSLLANDKNQTIRTVMPDGAQDFVSVGEEKIRREVVVSCNFKFSEETPLPKCHDFIESVTFPPPGVH